MSDEQVAKPADARDAADCEETWLLGQPPIASLLDFVEEMVSPPVPDRRALVDAWRDANDRYYELELAEAGFPDKIACKKLPPSLTGLADKVRADPRFAASFDTMPVSIEMVEIARLVLFQLHVSRHHVQRLKTGLGGDPSPQALGEFCMPLGASNARIDVQRLGSRGYAFRSDSLDFRAHDAVLLDPSQITGHSSFGAVGAVLALPVGFSSNFLSAVRSDGRLILHNGYHRAVALLELGIKFAPCIIETVTRRDELNLIAKRRVVEQPSFYLEAARPPVLKDFLDARLCRTFPTRRIRRIVEIRFEVEELTRPA